MPMRHKYHQHFTTIMLVVDVHYDRHHRHHDKQYEIFLTPNRRATLANVTVTVGHTVDFSLVFLDQNGTPMLTTPTPDTPPSWSNTTPATGTLTPAASGLTAQESALAAGTDTVSVSMTVGGASFSASIDLTVQAAPQILTSVQITAVAN
jgi:hypothetical protein